MEKIPKLEYMGEPLPWWLHAFAVLPCVVFGVAISVALSVVLIRYRDNKYKRDQSFMVTRVTAMACTLPYLAALRLIFATP